MMPEKIADVQPPRGILRWLARLPIWLYRAGLGWLLGNRFLMLTHIGRKSGQPRQAVLEVVSYDRADDTYYVAVGFGENTDWYRNLLRTPDVVIRVGRRQIAVRAGRLSPEEAERVIVGYARRHPLAIRELAHVLGWRVNGAEDDYRALGRIIPIIALRPRG